MMHFATMMGVVLPISIGHSWSHPSINYPSIQACHKHIEDKGNSAIMV